MNRIVTLIVLPAVSSSLIAQPVQRSASSGGNGHWYEAVQLDEEISWEDAAGRANDLGGYLVTLTSQEENTWVGLNIAQPLGPQPRHGPWIGLYQDRTSPDYSEPAGAWIWVTGEPLGYTNWDDFRPEPNNDANQEHWASMSHIEFHWNDVPSFTGNGQGVFSFIVEYDSDPFCDADLNRDGLLDLTDVSLFVGAFILNQPAADLDETGVFDLRDINDFIDAFSNGCEA